MPTISEALFEELCAARRVPCARIPVSIEKTPDFEVILGVQRVVVEVKQLDPNSNDQRIHAALHAGAEIDGVSAPTPRVRQHIAAAYRQLK
ncbi:MAG: hypothetical protein ACREMY_25020, partial [bacterium]